MIVDIQTSRSDIENYGINATYSLTEIATELHRVEGLRPRLEEARSLLTDLEARARELRTAWLLRQAEEPLSR